MQGFHLLSIALLGLGTKDHGLSLMVFSYCLGRKKQMMRVANGVGEGARHYNMHPLCFAGQRKTFNMCVCLLNVIVCLLTGHVHVFMRQSYMSE